MTERPNVDSVALYEIESWRMWKIESQHNSELEIYLVCWSASLVMGRHADPHHRWVCERQLVCLTTLEGPHWRKAHPDARSGQSVSSITRAKVTDDDRCDVRAYGQTEVNDRDHRLREYVLISSLSPSLSCLHFGTSDISTACQSQILRHPSHQRSPSVYQSPVPAPAHVSAPATCQVRSFPKYGLHG